MLAKSIPLGIYEKALPAGECWLERLKMCIRDRGISGRQGLPAATYRKDLKGRSGSMVKQSSKPRG